MSATVITARPALAAGQEAEAAVRELRKDADAAAAAPAAPPAAEPSAPPAEAPPDSSGGGGSGGGSGGSGGGGGGDRLTEDDICGDDPLC